MQFLLTGFIRPFSIDKRQLRNCLLREGFGEKNEFYFFYKMQPFKRVDPKNPPEPETVSTEKSIRNDNMKKEKGTITFEFEVKQWFMYYELIFQKKKKHGTFILR